MCKLFFGRRRHFALPKRRPEIDDDQGNENENLAQGKWRNMAPEDGQHFDGWNEGEEVVVDWRYDVKNGRREIHV